MSEDKKKMTVDMWHGLSKNLSTLRTFSSHVNNMIVGVRQKFRFKMRLVYSHFPINANIVDGGKRIEIRNYLGEKIVRIVDAVGDSKIEKSNSTKDELIIEGTDIEAVGRTCSLIHGICLCKKKDIRKFLDGIYVSEAAAIPDDE